MQYKIPRITADGIVIRNTQILLIKRKNQPFKDSWALPGGFVEYGETTEGAVIREIFEETGLKTRIQNLIGVYSKPDRDPRGHTITIAYRLEPIGGEMKNGDDAADVKFFKVNDLPNIAFDHANIIKDALKVGD